MVAMCASHIMKRNDGAVFRGLKHLYETSARNWTDSVSPFLDLDANPNDKFEMSCLERGNCNNEERKNISTFFGSSNNVENVKNCIENLINQQKIRSIVTNCVRRVINESNDVNDEIIFNIG